MTARDVRLAAILAAIPLVPLAILELLNQGLTRENAVGVLLLFAFLWLLPAAALVVLIPIVRGVRTSRAKLVLCITFALALVLVWGSLLADQMPCFLGVPNCD